MVNDIASGATNHGLFVSAFNVGINNLRFDNRITPHEASALQQAAAHFELP